MGCIRKKQIKKLIKKLIALFPMPKGRNFTAIVGKILIERVKK